MHGYSFSDKLYDTLTGYYDVTWSRRCGDSARKYSSLLSERPSSMYKFLRHRLDDLMSLVVNWNGMRTT